MDYERENYLRNLQQQQEMQHKLHLQHAEQQKQQQQQQQMQQQQHHQQQQQTQHQHHQMLQEQNAAVTLAEQQAAFNYQQHQQQQQQCHQYLQQQHTYHLQQQQQQQHHHQQQQQATDQANNQAQIVHHHHAQQQQQQHQQHQHQQMLIQQQQHQQLLRNTNLIQMQNMDPQQHQQQHQQQQPPPQQQHFMPTTSTVTTTPNYITNHSTAVTTTSTTNTLSHTPYTTTIPSTTPTITTIASTITTNAIVTQTTAAISPITTTTITITPTATTTSASSTTTTTNTFPMSINELHYPTIPSQQQQQQSQLQNNLNNINTTTTTTPTAYSTNNNNNINKTEDICLPSYNNNNNNSNNINNPNSNMSMNINNNLQNGTANGMPLSYNNKYYETYNMNPPLPSMLPQAAPVSAAIQAENIQSSSPKQQQQQKDDEKEIAEQQQQQQQQQTLDENDASGKDDLKRKIDGANDDDDDSPDLKKMLNDKNNLNANMRKNIRDVMDETQLDTNTLAAQREESERLARVAEQQKALREYQRQTAANRQFARTQNRVISLLQSGKTYAKFTESNVQEAGVTIDLELDDKKQQLLQQQPHTDSEKFKQEPASVDTSMDDEKSLTSPPSAESSKTERESQAPVGDVVTIEDSSSEDDCILLSDDEDEELLDDDAEDDPHNSGLHVNDNYNVPDEHGQVVVNVGHPEGEEDIYVAPQIAKTIKPHQIGGVRFLFDNVIESTKRFKSSSGFGCILAHSMGLGKTLQIVCFCDIFLRHTNSKTVLCVMPINTLQNWVNEFNMWIPKQSDDPMRVRPRHFDVFVLNDQHKTLSARAKVILRWAEQGGVLLIGYELFRLLALKIMPQRRRRGQKQLVGENVSSESHKRLTDSIYQALVKPGPDLVICDEGHRIKNAHAGISVALKQIRTRRRIVLTGYPLQNNLLEYWCMVDFVRPNYLGTRTEFCNMFERPIQNGQCVDSTPEDIKLMRYRAHVLHSLLLGFVQRRSHTVLQQTLPQKLEYVILTRMTSFQRQLYETFMNDVVRTRTVPNPLKAFSVCCKIWNHPDVLYNFLKRHEHDLDIEIEEGEIVPEVAAPTPAVEAPESSLTTTAATPNSVVSANLVEESQTSSSGFSSMTNEPKPASNETYEHMAYATPHHNVAAAPTSADCNGNNYWLEPNLPYYGNFPAVLPNHNSMQQPDYVGIVVKPNGPGLQESTCSSEIVDLDTKEIKTVETDFDMERNTVIKSEQASPVKDTKSSEAVAKGAEEVVKPVEREVSRWSDGVPYDWALELMRKYEPDLIENSPKMEVFFCILQQSIELGDRVLLFSQSLLTLNLIERFLQANYVPGTESYWGRNISYFRLDGSTSSQERERLVTEFNSNFNVKLFLISTRAGSLGINLVGANRVVVFDASWNPCHDTQAVYRIYRYGQKKACYVYRIVMDRCLEKKIYDRQIKKQGMSDRVVDECNPDAHLSLKDVTNLCHDYDDDHKAIPDDENFKTPVDQYLDEVVKKVLIDYKGCLSKEPFYHESLLIDRKEKKLSQAEKRQAHRGYEMEKKASVRQTLSSTTNKMQYRIVRNEGVSVARPVTTNTTRNSGIRSTRWIPAEVWQRQGMTAQEMTLPLDVVIPTNSSDKSNIILKAGQRVMVLKSAKGIYMQLDSGKIIAIRTSSKATDTSANSTTNGSNKTNAATTITTTTSTTSTLAISSSSSDNKSNEVIDITADGDNASNQTTSSISSSSNSNSCSSISNTSKSNYMTSMAATNNNNMVDMKPTINSSLFAHNNLNSSLNKPLNDTTLATTKDIKHKTDAFMNNGLNVKNNIAHQSPQHLQQTQHFIGNSGKSTQRRKPTQKIEITSNERLPPIKGFNANQFTATKAALINTKNNTTEHLFDAERNLNLNLKNKKPQSTNDNVLVNAQQQKQKMHQQNAAAYGNNIQKPLPATQQLQPETHFTTHHPTPHHHNIQTNFIQPQAQPQPIQTPVQSPLAPSATTTTHTPQISPTTSLTVHRNDIGNHAYEVHNKPIYARPEEPHPPQPQPTSLPLPPPPPPPSLQQQLPTAVSPKNKLKTATTECFQNQNVYQQQTKSNLENNIHDAKSSAVLDRKSTNDYLPPPPSSPQQQQQQQQQHATSIAGNGTYNKLSTESLPTYMQYTPPTSTSQQQQQPQANKMRLYMPQYGVPATHTHPHYGNTLPATVSVGQPPTTTPTVTTIAAAPPPTAPPPVSMLTSTYPKAVHNYPQYYEGMYENIPSVEYGTSPATHTAPPGAAGYPDYSAYSHHAPYHTNFQANAYGCSPLSAPVRAPPYMHWSPLVTSASLAEHHAAANSMFSTANYANDAAAAAAAQANQWHHQ